MPMGRFERWLRRNLWVWVVLLAMDFVLTWAFGWSTAHNILFVAAIVVLIPFLAFNIWSGWVEWRQRRHQP